MKRPRKSAMGRKLAAIAAGPLIDGTHINVWLDEGGEPHAEPGRKVSIPYRRADGGPLLNAQKGDK
jgi:hypothetical protein